MSQHVTIHIHAHNDHAVLQRALLAFSRRRLRILALQMFDLHAEQPAELQIDLSCSAETARELTSQLARIVEVEKVWFECYDELRSRDARGVLSSAAQSLQVA